MFDFRRDSKVPNYLGSKQQRRLLVVLALVGVLAILVSQARDYGSNRPVASTELGSPPAPGDQSSSAPDPEDPRPDEDAHPDASERQTFFPGVRPDYLKAVEDDTVFRTAEADAWFHLLALLESTDPIDLERASLGRVGFLQLDQQAAEYRGRLVTIEGTVRGAKLVAAPVNGYSIGEYYQLWLQPERSSPELIAVYTLTVPEGFPLGTDLDAPCKVTGFFFKRWAYPVRDGIATAPLVLAKTVDWQPGPVTPAPIAPAGEQFVWAVLVAFVLAVAIVGFLMARGRASGRSRHTIADGSQLHSVLLRETESAGDRVEADNDHA